MLSSTGLFSQVLTIDPEAGSAGDRSSRVGDEEAEVAAFILLRHILDHYGAVVQSTTYDLHFASEVWVHCGAKDSVEGGEIGPPILRLFLPCDMHHIFRL